MATLYSNFQQGTLSASISISDTGPSSTAFASLPVVASPNELWLVLDPTGVAGVPEVVRVTGHTASAQTVTVERGAQGSTARSHSAGTTWSLSTTSTDMGGVTPVGSITAFAASTAPTGWLLCDGQAVSRTTYAHLFAVIGTTYGTGNGSTTFNVPNLKGRIPVGLDSAQTEFDVLGETGGAKTHTLTTAEMPSHTHTQDSHNHTQNAHTHTGSGRPDDATSTGNWYNTVEQTTQAVQTTGEIAAASTTATNIATTATNQNTGGGGAHNNLQPYIALNYIIRAA